MTNYDDTFQKVNVIFDNDKLQNTLGEVVAKNGLSQIRISNENIRCFFFSGGREATLIMKRLMVNHRK